MQKFKIITLGCKVNQAESAAIANQLQQQAIKAVDGQEPADLCIINTCTVTGKASMQSRQAVRQAMRANPNARIVVTGCYAQTAPQEIRAIAGVDLILGNDGKHRIVEMLHPETPGDLPRAEIVPAASNPRWLAAAALTPRARAFLKVQDGCNARCSYCIVPAARGASRSQPVEDVLDSICRLADAGYPEVVLTGIHLGHYGLDLDPPSNLLALLRKIRKQTAVRRVRLSSIEPLELGDDLICLAAESAGDQTAICPHFHVPLQSGDNGILRRMQRPYTREMFRDLIRRIKRNIPAAGLGVDVLVGFPGESDAAFENTCLLLEELPVTYLHVFPFSRRSGTPADRMPDQLPAAIVKKRCRRLRTIGKKKKLDFYRQHTGCTLEVVAESYVDAEHRMIKGTSANYIPVTFKGSADMLRRLVSVRIDRLDPHGRVFGTVQS